MGCWCRSVVCVLLRVVAPKVPCRSCARAPRRDRRVNIVASRAELGQLLASMGDQRAMDRFIAMTAGELRVAEVLGPPPAAGRALITGAPICRGVARQIGARTGSPPS